MENEQYYGRIMELREGMKGYSDLDDGVHSDQQQNIEQPSLEKGYMGGKAIKLTKEFDKLIKKSNILDLLNERVSRRNYTLEEISLEELSFLLWATQGVKKVIGKERKATLRTVPSAGARHAFETYLFINRVTGLTSGLYHYIALEHSLEFIETQENQIDRLTEAYLGQSFFANAAVAFVWTVQPYRMEWRYTTKAQKYALLDAGHVCQNLYLACEALELGTCAIGAYEQALADNLIHLDSLPSCDKNNEFVVYAASVGRVK